MRIECPNCRSSVVVEMDIINQDINCIKCQGEILGHFQCD